MKNKGYRTILNRFSFGFFKIILILKILSPRKRNFLFERFIKQYRDSRGVKTKQKK